VPALWHALEFVDAVVGELDTGARDQIERYGSGRLRCVRGAARAASCSAALRPAVRVAMQNEYLFVVKRVVCVR
jgi:hypothetical protein